MSDETTEIELISPFLYAVVYPCGEIFTTHKSKRIALGIAMQEREWVAGCTVIPLYAVPKSLSENASQINEVEINISAKEVFLALSSAAFKRENELEQKLSDSEARCAALAAEMSAVLTDRAVILEDLDNTCFEIGMQRGEKVSAYPAPTVANHDALLAEVRAQGVEMFAIEWGGHDSPYGQDAYNFADKIRKGVQS